MPGVCFFLTLGSDSSPSSDASYPEFADVFIIFWIGSIVVTINSKLLGGQISFFQCVCVLGYCVLPLAISLILSRIVLFAVGNWKVFLQMYDDVAMIAIAWRICTVVVITSMSMKLVSVSAGNVEVD